MLLHACGGRPAVLPARSQACVRALSSNCKRATLQVCCAVEPDTTGDVDIKSDAERKKEEADKLRSQETFMRVSAGDALCLSCGYKYLPENGDPEYPVARGTKFQNLPEDWNCPVCGAGKEQFQENVKEIAGFAVNQGYGLGTNSWTGEQKQLVIYGALGLFFLLLLAGYFIE